MRQNFQTAWVLGGGAALGAVQVGQISALHDRGLRPDLVVGVSVGALNGALVALDPDTAPARLTELWSGLRRSDVLPWTAGPPWRSGGLFGGAGLRRILGRAFGDLSFEDLTVPLRVLTADARTGEPVVFGSGPLAPALLASTAIPYLLPPVTHQGRSLVDGGTAAAAVVEVAVAAGARAMVTLRALSSPYLRGAPGLLGMWGQRSSERLVRAAVSDVARLDLGDGLVRRLRRPLRFSGTAPLIALGRAEADTVLSGWETRPPVTTTAVPTVRRGNEIGEAA